MQTNLIQARFLFERARLLWEPYRDISNGLVVSLLQDSSELMTWAVVKKHSIQVREQEGFASILDKISAAGLHVHGKAEILTLNKARVSFKHYGVTPASSDIPRFIDGAGYFLSENAKEHLGYNFNTVSLADSVLDDEVRAYLKLAERFRDEGVLEEALVQVSMAFERVLRVAHDYQYGDAPRLDEWYELLPSEVQNKANLLLLQTKNFLEDLGKGYAVLALGVSQSLLKEIEERCFTVNVSEGGKRLGVHARNKTSITLENVNFLISNVTDMARRLPGKDVP